MTIRNENSLLEGSAESGEFGVFKSPDHGWTLLGFAEPPLNWTCCWQNDFKPRSATSFESALGFCEIWES